MCNTGKVLKRGNYFTSASEGAWKKFHNFYDFLCFLFYRCRDLAGKCGLPPLTAKKKIALKVSLSLFCTSSQSPRWFTPGVRPEVLFESELRIPTALCASFIFEHDLHILAIKSRKYSCHRAPDQLLRDKWIRVCFLAALSEESILFITAGWAAEEWLATPARKTLVMPWIWDFQSRQEEALKCIKRCPKQSNPSPDN